MRDTIMAARISRPYKRALPWLMYNFTFIQFQLNKELEGRMMKAERVGEKPACSREMEKGGRPALLGWRKHSPKSWQQGEGGIRPLQFTSKPMSGPEI